ncbi:DUF5391 family protein [Alkalihalobacillus pseudalcaliphilus]|uniref:DUF5391 family protein n=1 Tax=Alkalihalobacillus pseudalcaliphilus TaxID=79884 RepID=UPI00064E0915|nr:DUF5391 family protein [Alkalihalobacillus pseudalcaliphilus]KMK76540.1 hypothetical protein AB990_15330 [Alkalihalobacillus pseudalcaliphilus]
MVHVDERKRKVLIVTGISAFLYCLHFLCISLSPISQIGENTSQFGNGSFFYTLVIVLIAYALPLIGYYNDLYIAKYIMAFLNGFGIFVALSIIMALMIFSVFADPNINQLSWIMLILAIVLGVGVVIINIVWYYIMFKKEDIQKAI